MFANDNLIIITLLIHACIFGKKSNIKHRNKKLLLLLLEIEAYYFN